MKALQRISRFPKLGLLLLAFIAFIALGMPDGLLGVAWPSVRSSFSIPIDAIGMLIPVSVAGYLISSFASGPLLTRWGVGKILSVSCALTGLALWGYTLVPSWWMMVLLGFPAGLGAGAIDAGLNTYIAAHFGEGLMQWLHASYGIGVTLGPIIMTIALSSFESWRIGYRIVGSFQILLAIAFAFTLAMWHQNDEIEKNDELKRLTDYKTSMAKTMRQLNVWLSVLLFFFYVGAEVSLGTWAYSLLTESRGIDPTLAGIFAGSYWATFTIGRILAGLYAKKIGGHKLIQISIILALSGSLILLWNPSEIGNLLAVALIGFAIAPIFPAMMSGTRNRVGIEYAANTIGIQMAFTGLGTAVIPSVLGVFAKQYSLEVVPICLVLVFSKLFILYRIAMSTQNKIQEI